MKKYLIVLSVIALLIPSVNATEKKDKADEAKRVNDFCLSNKPKNEEQEAMCKLKIIADDLVKNQDKYKNGECSEFKNDEEKTFLINCLAKLFPPLKNAIKK